MEKLVQKTPLKDHKHFLYTVYKQQYLELIEQLEYQKVWLKFSVEMCYKRVWFFSFLFLISFASKETGASMATIHINCRMWF